MPTAVSDLLRAVASRNQEEAAKLLKAKNVKKNINDVDVHGNSALNYACALGSPPSFILKLLELGADPKIANNMGAVPLTHAVYSKMGRDVVTALVKHGANPNYQNESGATALQIACVCRAPLDTVQALLDLGADPHLANAHGNTPLTFAVRNHNDLEVVELLAKLTGENQINQQLKDDPKFPMYTPLHFAAVEHLPAIAATLVKYGALTDIQNGHGLTPLQLCDEHTKVAMMSAEHARGEYKQ